MREGQGEREPRRERAEEGSHWGGRAPGRAREGSGEEGREWGRGGVQAPLHTRTACMGETGGSGRG
jgi:hypothetical protein